MNNKKNKILGVISIVWGSVLLIYQIIRNTVLSNWYSDMYLKQLLTAGTESAEKFKLGFETFNNFLNIFFIISLIIIVILIIITNKKRNIKFISKEVTNNGTIYMYIGLLLYILMGWNLISVIIVPIGGFLFYKN